MKNLEVLRLEVEKINAGAPVVLLDGVSQAQVHGCKVAAGPGVFVRCAGESNPGMTLEGNRLAEGVKEREP